MGVPEIGTSLLGFEISGILETEGELGHDNKHPLVLFMSPTPPVEWTFLEIQLFPSESWCMQMTVQNN